MNNSLRAGSAEILDTNKGEKIILPTQWHLHEPVRSNIFLYSELFGEEQCFNLNHHCIESIKIIPQETNGNNYKKIMVKYKELDNYIKFGNIDILESMAYLLEKNIYANSFP